MTLTGAEGPGFSENQIINNGLRTRPAPLSSRRVSLAGDRATIDDTTRPTVADWRFATKRRCRRDHAVNE
jgi:hypothetical protein